MRAKDTLAFNVDAIRREMLERVVLPPELINMALLKTREKLNAHVTKFFTYQGQVIEKVDVEDHETQLRAADQVYSLAGMYARERDGTPATPAVAIEVDPQTGVVRLIIGTPSSGMPESLLQVAEPIVKSAELVAVSAPEAAIDAEYIPQIVKVSRPAKRGELHPDIRKALFDE